MEITILDDGTINPGDLSWDALKKLGKLTQYDRTATLASAIERSKDTEILLTSKVAITKEFLDACPQLKMICVLATGYNNIDVDYAKSKNILVTNIPAYSSEIVAQHTIALLLAICQLPSQSISLAGKTIGVIGYGNISRKVIGICKALGMHVLISSNYPDPSMENDLVSFCSMEDLLSQADILSLHCPMTEENQGFINKELLYKMKPGVILLNTSRGGLVDEEDLAQALACGQVSFAGLDVLEQEPPVKGSPLIGLKNALITPHIAWSAKETRERLIQIAIENVQAFLEKEPIHVI